MGIKLEYILGLIIIALIAITTSFKIPNKLPVDREFTKELEFIDTTFIEVDMNSLQRRAYSRSGVRDSGVLKLDSILFHSNNIESLSANSAEYKKDILSFNGDVIIKEKSGYIYNTQKAIYNKKTEIINIISPFIGKMNKNIIRGDSLVYDTNQEKVSAKFINASFYIP